MLILHKNKQELIQRCTAMTTKSFSPVALSARYWEHAASMFFIILFVPGLNLSECFHHMAVIGPLSLLAGVLQILETPC
jgi:hypothetical protein